MIPATFLAVLLLSASGSSWAGCPEDPGCPATTPETTTAGDYFSFGATSLVGGGVNAITPAKDANGLQPGVKSPSTDSNGVSNATQLANTATDSGLTGAERANFKFKKGKPETSAAGTDDLPVTDNAKSKFAESSDQPCDAQCHSSAVAVKWGNEDHVTTPDGRVIWQSDAFPGQGAATPDAEAARRKAVLLSESGDRAGALALAQNALARHPEDKALQNFVKSAQHNDLASKSIKDRAKELLASMRGDAGDAPPPGAAIMASPLAFTSMNNAGRPLPPSALAAAGIGQRDGGLRLADPLVRDAASKFAIRDFPGAQSLLDRRLAADPSDEPALRLRAFTLRQMKRYEPSAADAKSALTLAPWDSRAHRVLIDDQVDLGHSAEALDEADRAMSASPNDPQILAARANVWASLGNREKQLADLKQAAALDTQFDQLYEQAVMAGSEAPSRRPRSGLVWLGAVGTALLFFSFALFRKRGDSSVRLAMRAADHEILSRGARPDAAPAGFRIVKTLGQGGMGVVYEAVDLGLQRTVALKKLRAEIADSPRERARFLKEARTVAALKHPNIVEIHAIHEDAEGLFLVFEKIDGESLHERLGRGPLRAGEAVSYLRQIAMALDHAHSAGVVHQDLKPANIMVAGDRAKVMDFGIARRVQETMSTLSRIEVAGTPAYMAPEQERGGGVGPAADVFALGACAYELLTGRTPFPNGGMMMKAEKMYRPASEVSASVPMAADAVIGRALEPDPAARWPSAASFVEALARSLS
jgi:tetratricopeptide (TPR) repeat protein